MLRWGVSCILVLGDGERGQVLAEVGGLDDDGWFGSEGRKGGRGGKGRRGPAGQIASLQLRRRNKLI